MISKKMKEDAARIKTEIGLIGRKITLVSLNYNYLNENATLVLKRRKSQLDEIGGVKEFLKENAEFSSLLNKCEKEFTNINNELKKFGVFDSDANNSNEESSEGVNCNQFKNMTISRDNSCIPDTPAIRSNRKKLHFIL